VTRLRDFLLRPPRRADGRVALLATGLAVTGLALPETGRIGGASTLGALKAALVVGGVLLAPVALGYRRRSPVLAWGVLYGLLVTIGFASGVWQLTGSVGPTGDVALAYELLVYEAPAYATLLAAGGYPLGYVTSLAENRLRTATA